MDELWMEQTLRAFIRLSKPGNSGGRSFTHQQYLLSTYFVLGTDLDPGVMAMHKTGKAPGPHGLAHLLLLDNNHLQELL